MTTEPGPDRLPPPPAPGPDHDPGPVAATPAGPAAPPTPRDRPAGLPFRPAVLLVGLLAVLGMVGVIVVFGDGGGSSPSVTAAVGGQEAPTAPDGGPREPVTIANPAALAPPGGVAVPPTVWPDATMEWRTDQAWTSVLVWYYESFPIDGLALDPSDGGKSSVDGVPVGERHAIVAEGTTGAPSLSPFLHIEADPQNPTGSIVSYVAYD